MKLTVQNVIDTVLYCMYHSEETEGLADGNVPPEAVVFTGVHCAMGFHPGRLEEKRPDIQSMIDQLPEEFNRRGGGGRSFHEACADRDGRNWGEPRQVDALLCLGGGLGIMGYCEEDRKTWSDMPDGVPEIWAKQTDNTTEVT